MSYLINIVLINDIKRKFFILFLKFDLLLSEISQSEKDKHYMVSFIWGI